MNEFAKDRFVNELEGLMEDLLGAVTDKLYSTGYVIWSKTPEERDAEIDMCQIALNNHLNSYGD